MNKKTGELLKASILSSLQLKTTDELVEIWTKNDHNEWTDDAFDAIKELLLARLDVLPEQNKLIGTPDRAEKTPDGLLTEFQSLCVSNVGLTLFLAVCMINALFLFFFDILLAATWVLPHFILGIGEGIPWHTYLLAILTIPVFYGRRQVAASLKIKREKLVSLLEQGANK